MRGRVRQTAVAVGLMLCVLGCTGADGDVGEGAGAGPSGPSDQVVASETVPDVSDDASLLMVAERKDGDSFLASDGVEYRVGLINTPERGECGGAEASAITYDLLAGGFTAQTYSSDVHGRSVARIMTSEGDLGVLLAERGYADDRYLDQFRSENPAYAAELERAFATARQDDAGLYGTCWAEDAQRTVVPAGAPVTHVGGGRGYACHPAYLECLPDGPDLDCAEVGHQVQLLGDADPFRLDGNSLTATDGVGCDTFEPWRADGRYPYQAS